MRYVWSALGVGARMVTLLAWLLLGAIVLSVRAHSAEPPVPTVNVGETYVLNWVQEPVCTNGVPIAECPITGYHVQIEREQSMLTWNNVSTAPMAADRRSYTWTANGRGTTCFRVNVLNSAAYEATGPSNIRCVNVLVPLKPGAKAPVLSSSKD